MPVLNFTTYDDIRAALGVEEAEIEDETLALDLYEAHLKGDLVDIHPRLAETHTGLLGKDPTTEAESWFMTCANTFATYSVAKALTITLPMFGPKTIEDGKARLDRFSDPYKDTIKGVLAEWERWKKRTLDAFLAVDDSTQVRAARVYLSVVTPAYNPITGEGY